jgi:AcrR family transcriptional regulator
VAEPRRPRAATAEKRARILDAAEQIMLRDGYAAVTSRRVEAVAGVKLHYHFGTVDDLFVAVFRRRAERNVDRLRDALTSAEPLRAWWELASDPRGTALLVELTAAANHRSPLQAEVAELARDVRRMEMATLASILDDYGIDQDELPPALVAAAVQGLALVVVQDQVRGFDTGHDDAAAAMHRLLERLERDRAMRRGCGSSAGSLASEL